MWDWVGKGNSLVISNWQTNPSSVFALCVFFGRMQQVGLSPLRTRMGQRRKSRWWGRRAIHLNPKPKAATPIDTAMPRLPSWFSSPISEPSLGQILVTAAPNIPLSSQHGYSLPVEAVFPEAGLLPGQLWFHLGHDVAAFHHPAASQPWEQCCTEATDPGPQQALHQGPGWGKPKCHGWALCGYHDSLRWVVCSCNDFQTARWEWCELKTLHEM